MIVPELQRILFKSQKQDVKTIWDKLPQEVQIYVFKKIREKNCVDLGKLYNIYDSIFRPIARMEVPITHHMLSSVNSNYFL